MDYQNTIIYQNELITKCIGILYLNAFEELTDKDALSHIRGILESEEAVVKLEEINESVYEGLEIKNPGSEPGIN